MIADKIKSIREKEGLTQEELAKELFVSRTAVTKWETGKSLPTIETLRMISEKYGISLDELIHNEVESGLYTRIKNSGRQRIVLCAIILACIAAIVALVSPLAAQLKKGYPYEFSANEVVNYQDAMKIVPGILDEWTEEKGYCYADMSDALGYSFNQGESFYEIYETEEDKQQNKELYSLFFRTYDYGFSPEVQIYGTDLSNCVEEAVKKMGDAKDLIKRITGRDIDIDQIKTIAEDAFNDIQSKMENGIEPATSSGNSLVDLYVVKIDHDVFYETCYEGMDYQVGLTLNLDYHSDLMS